jgi:hypothetical protein
MGKVKAAWQEEYENMHPEDVEFAEWVESMETKIKLAVTKKTKIVLHKNNTEEYSPYITINS